MYKKSMLKFLLSVFVLFVAFGVTASEVFAIDDSAIVTQIVFYTDEQTIDQDVVSSILTVQTQNSSSVPVKVSETTHLTLTSSSATGEFSSNATNWISVSELTMNSGTGNKNFYYRDSVGGVYTLTVIVTEGTVTPATQTIEVIGVDITPPTIVSSDPANGAVGVSSTDNIVVTFDEDVVVSASNVVISGSVEKTALYDSTTQTLTIDPDTSLSYNKTYTVTLTGVKDLAGNLMLNQSFSFKTVSGYSIDLVQGWNLISFPVIPVDTDLAVVLASSGDVSAINGVFSYDALTEEWLIYRPEHPELSSFDTVTSGKSYWIYYEGTQGNISGLGNVLEEGDTTPSQHKLTVGWNMVGYYQLENVINAPTVNSLKTINGYWSTLLRFDAVTQEFEIIGAEYEMKPGEGYWIFMTPSVLAPYTYSFGDAPGVIEEIVEEYKEPKVVVTRNDGFSNEIIIGGAKDVPFMRFVIEANDASDVLVSSLVFGQNSGTYATSDVTNMKLFIDGVQKGSSFDLSSGILNDANFTVFESQQVQVELRIDTNTVSENKTLQIELTSLDITDEDEKTITATVLPLHSDTMTIGTSGTFTLAKDGDSPDGAILVADGGTTWYPVLTYKLTAVDEDLLLTDLSLVNWVVGATSTDADARIQTLGLFDESGVLKQSKTLTGGAVSFILGNGDSAVTVPANDSARITIKVKLNTINDSTKTGKVLELNLQNPGVPDDGVVVQSSSVGTDLTASQITASPVGADTFVIRKTVPTITVPTQPFTSLSPRTGETVYKFTVSADANEDVNWKKVVLDVTETFAGTGSLSNWKIYESGTVIVNDGAPVLALGQVEFVVTTEEVVTAGTSKTYEIRADITGVVADDDSIDVHIANIADDASGAVVTGAYTGTLDTVVGSFIWSDNSALAHNLTTLDWTNDRYVEIDNTSWNISK